MHTTCETSIRAAAALMIYLLKYSSKGQAWQDAQAPPCAQLCRRRRQAAQNGFSQAVCPERVRCLFACRKKRPCRERGILLNRERQKRAPIYEALEKFRRQRVVRSEEHTSELQSRFDLVCRLLLEKKKR